ncbi:methyltransferase N6AMT1 [Coccinella septempunctata]|uniref:methyltransferase N6AMT1 n=1 Tax=Coccinella septempunctata TaxID=41139 RepID=UPI001D0659CE|nr:methyltransferase N6AMT1 [Coccinella septempunctata]
MELSTAKYDLKHYANVYEPREDSFLLLDALELQISFLKTFKPLLTLEVGSGSGVVVTSLASVIKDSAYFAVDINNEACMATKNTARLNGCNIEVLNSNLIDGFKSCLFDLVLFNPPYVITDSDEYDRDIINKAWAGGLMGREIIDKFIERLPKILSKRGLCYLLLLKENNVHEIGTKLSGLNFMSQIILERKIIGENLLVMKIFREG